MKKIIIVCICTLVIVLFCIYLLSRPKFLGNINQSVSDEETGSSEISFSAEAGDKIKFSFKSNVHNGNLDIILYDSMGNSIYELDKAKALETYYTFEKSDIYTLTAKYIDFIGEYSIDVYDAD